MGTQQNALVGFSIDPKFYKEKIDQQGKQANVSGKTAEEIIYGILKGHNYTVHKQYKINAIGLYGEEIRVDFFVERIEQFPSGLIVECKRQEVSGSADKKLVYDTENIRLRYPHPTFLILTGKGFRLEVINYIKSKADSQKLVSVYTLEEFITWAIHNL